MRTFELRAVMFTCIALAAIVPSAASQYMDGWPLDPRDCEGLTGRFNCVPPPVPGDVLYYVTALGGLPGGSGHSVPRAINNLGQVTGDSSVGDYHLEAFLWDPVEGMIGLGDLPGGSHLSTGMAVNNLSHVAGGSDGAHGWEAFFWAPETGMIGLGTLPGGSHTCEGRGMNDLDQVVGYSWSGSGQQAFLWDAEHGMIGLGDLPGGQFLSVARDINNSMQVVGDSSSEDHLWEAFIWDPVNGMRPLDDTGGSIYPASAYAINEVGQVTGYTNTGDVFLWDPQDGLINLGRPDPDDLVAYGRAINDVPQVVGYAIRPGWPDDEFHAFVWDAQHGMRDLETLIAAEIDPPYWLLLRYASGINNAGQIAAYANGCVLTPFVLGDLNCDELVDEADIPALLLLLVDPDEYAQTYPDCPGEWAGDINQDGVLDPADLYALRDFLGCAPSADPGHYVPPDHVSPVP